MNKNALTFYFCIYKFIYINIYLYPIYQGLLKYVDGNNPKKRGELLRPERGQYWKEEGLWRPGYHSLDKGRVSL